jgi:hypothetical protein
MEGAAATADGSGTRLGGQGRAWRDGHWTLKMHPANSHCSAMVDAAWLLARHCPEGGSTTVDGWRTGISVLVGGQWDAGTPFYRQAD